MRRTLLLGLLATAAVAGCGGDDEPTAVAAATVDAAFSAKVEGACQELDKGNPPFTAPEGWDRHDPTAAQLRAIAGYMVKLDASFSTAPAALRAVGEPATGKAEWQTFLTALQTEANSIKDRVSAAKAADVAAWKAAMDQADTNNAALGSAFATAGLEAPTCHSYLGV